MGELWMMTHPQSPKHPCADIRLHCFQDQVELNHLQGNCDRPIDVAIEDGRAVDDDPKFSHVEIMHCCHQGNQGSHVHGSLPMVTHCHGLHQEEHGCSHH